MVTLSKSSYGLLTLIDHEKLHLHRKFLQNVLQQLYWHAYLLATDPQCSEIALTCAKFVLFMKFQRKYLYQSSKIK